MFLYHDILFILLDPWHATQLAALIGLVLVGLAAMAVRSAMNDEKQRGWFGSIAFALAFAGSIMIVEGISLGSHIPAIAQAQSNNAWWHVNHVNAVMTVPYVSMINVFLLLMMVAVGVIVVQMLDKQSKQMLSEVAIMLIAATLTVASDITIYANFLRIMALVTTILWLVTGFTLVRVIGLAVILWREKRKPAATP